MLVEAIMTRDLVTLTPDTTLQAALEISRKHRIRHLPVVVAGTLVGLVSDRDLRSAAPSTLETGAENCNPINSHPTGGSFTRTTVTVTR